MNPQSQPPRRWPGRGRGGRIGSNDDCLIASRRGRPGRCGAVAAPGGAREPMIALPNPVFAAVGRPARELGEQRARPEIRLQAPEKARFAPENGMAPGSAVPRDASGLRRGEPSSGASRLFPGREPVHRPQACRSPRPQGGWPPDASDFRFARNSQAGWGAAPSTALRAVPLPRKRGRIARAGAILPCGALAQRGRGTTRSVVEGARRETDRRLGDMRPLNAQLLEKAQFMHGSGFPWRSFCFRWGSLSFPWRPSSFPWSSSSFPWRRAPRGLRPSWPPRRLWSRGIVAVIPAKAGIQSPAPKVLPAATGCPRARA